MNEHQAQIDISPERMARWFEAASALGDEGIGLGLELKLVKQDPSRHNLNRAAKAARFAESVTSGDRQMIANATASEIESDAS